MWETWTLYSENFNQISNSALSFVLKSGENMFTYWDMIIKCFVSCHLSQSCIRKNSVSISASTHNISTFLRFVGQLYVHSWRVWQENFYLFYFTLVLPQVHGKPYFLVLSWDDRFSCITWRNYETRYSNTTLKSCNKLINSCQLSAYILWCCHICQSSLCPSRWTSVNVVVYHHPQPILSHARISWDTGTQPNPKV